MKSKSIDTGCGILFALWVMLIASIGITLISLVIYILYRVAISI